MNAFAGQASSATMICSQPVHCSPGAVQEMIQALKALKAAGKPAAALLKASKSTAIPAKSLGKLKEIKAELARQRAMLLQGLKMCSQ